MSIHCQAKTDEKNEKYQLWNISGFNSKFLELKFQELQGKDSTSTKV